VSLPPEHLLDELATSYVQAVAANAGATIAVSRKDYGVDGTLKHIVKVNGNRYVESGYPVDFQLKGTTTAEFDGKNVVYDLKVRNYDLIVSRDASATPYQLFLVCFGKDSVQWTSHDDRCLALNASAFWWTASGLPSTNIASVRLKIPMTNALTCSSIENMLEQAKNRFAR
jgi:Domain of unknown function (DUF4365)